MWGKQVDSSSDIKTKTITHTHRHTYKINYRNINGKDSYIYLCGEVILPSKAEDVWQEMKMKV